MKSSKAKHRSSGLGQFVRLVRPHLTPKLGAIGLAVLLGSLTSFGQAAPVLLLGPLFEVLFPGEEVDGFAPEAADETLRELFGRFVQLFTGIENEQNRLLVAVATALVALGVFSALAQYAFLLISRWVAYTLVVELRQRIAKHLMGLSMRYHGKREFGDLLSRISADVQLTLQSMDVLLRELIQEPALALTYLGIAVWVAPDLLVVLLIALVALAIPIAVLSRRVRKGSRRSLNSLGASVQAMTQMFQGVRTVKAFRAEERELARYGELNQEFLRQSMKMVRSIALTRATSTLTSNLGLGALLVVIGWFVINREEEGLGPAEMSMFFISVAQAYNHLRRATQGVTKLQESLGAAERLQELLDEEVDLVEPKVPVPFSGVGAGIEFRGVSYRYEDPTGEEGGYALQNLVLHVQPGETLALVGPSGSGKSTSMDLVARFLDPTEGQVVVGGHDLREYSTDDWIAQIAMVGQVPFLFHATIGENIRYGKPDASQSEVEAAARAAQIHEFIVSLPAGYDTDVADAGSRLSGGQRQRIAIARALLKHCLLYTSPSPRDS